MQIKLINHQDAESNINRREFVTEAIQYRLQIMYFNDEEQMWEYLQNYGEYSAPFSLDAKSERREIMILQITEPIQTAIVATGCHVFVMNEKGKTIDRFSISNELPQESK